MLTYRINEEKQNLSGKYYKMLIKGNLNKWRSSPGTYTRRFIKVKISVQYKSIYTLKIIIKITARISVTRAGWSPITYQAIERPAYNCLQEHQPRFAFYLTDGAIRNRIARLQCMFQKTHVPVQRPESSWQFYL